MRNRSISISFWRSDKREVVSRSRSNLKNCMSICIKVYLGISISRIWTAAQGTNAYRMLFCTLQAFLPQLLFARKPQSKTNRNTHALTRLSLATGSEGMAGLGMQAVMGGIGGMEGIGDIMQRHGNVSPKILGGDTLHIEVPDLEDYSTIEKLRLEQDTLGFALTCNEMELIDVPEAVASKELYRYAAREVKVAGVAAAGHRHTCKDGSVMLFLTLQDRYGLIETVLFPETYKAHTDLLAKGGNGPYLVSGRAQVTGKGRGIGVQLPFDLQTADAVTIKMHPIIVVERMSLLNPSRLAL